MPIDMVRLPGREDVADGTLAFHFEKPEGFLYEAEQFADWTLIDPPHTDVEGNTRGFSLASAPYEQDLRSATRRRETACKRELKHLSDGTQLKLEAPYGSFTLHATTAIPAVFLIGGGGSTPVGSMVLEATTKAPPRRQPSRAGRKWYPSQPDAHSYVMSSAIAGHPAARARCRDQSIEG